MKQPYLTIPFSFSDDAYASLRAIVDPLYEQFEVMKAPGGNQSQFTNPAEFQEQVHASLAGQELAVLLKQYGLPRPMYQLFMYRNAPEQQGGLGNPHFDSLTPELFCPFRFNILLDGDATHEMAWWDIDPSSDLIELINFTHANGRQAWRWQVKGNTIQDRLNLIGDPTWRAGSLSIPQQTASFLRTNKVHAIEMHGKKRIVFSLRFNVPWEVIEQHIESNEHVLARYGQQFGGATPPVTAPSNAIIDMILQHKSVRRFKPDEPPFGTVELLTAAAQSASSSGFAQLWSVVSVDDRDLRKRLMRDEFNKTAQEEAPICLVFLADLTRVASIYGPKAGDALDYAEYTMLAMIDAAMASQTMVIAAESLGLGCIYHGSLRVEPHIAIDALGLPKHTFPLFGMCIGYASGNTDIIQPYAIRPRFSQRWVLHRNKYVQPSRDEVARYDKVIRNWQRAHSTDVQFKKLRDWSNTLWKRVVNIDKSLSSLLAKAGFNFK